MILTVLAAVGGYLQVFNWWVGMDHWLEEVAPSLHHPTGVQELVSSVAGTVMGLIGVYLAWTVYGSKRDTAPKPLAILEKKFYFDELYDAIAYRPAATISRLLARVIEGPLVIGSGDVLGRGTRALGERIRPLQSGMVRAYALLIALSFAVIALVFLVVR
jgi:NADH-quinone oxidoreductase subunit L